MYSNLFLLTLFLKIGSLVKQESFFLRHAKEKALVRIFPRGALTLGFKGERLAEKTLAIRYANAEMNMSSQSLSFDVNAAALAYKTIDPAELQARLAGTSKEQAALSLSQNPVIQKAGIVLFPFWLGFLPQDASGVEITMVID